MDLNSESLFSSIQMQIFKRVLVFRKEQNLSNYRFEFLLFKKKEIFSLFMYLFYMEYCTEHYQVVKISNI